MVQPNSCIAAKETPCVDGLPRLAPDLSGVMTNRLAEAQISGPGSQNSWDSMQFMPSVDSPGTMVFCMSIKIK